jgi:hypothetical protein
MIAVMTFVSADDQTLDEFWNLIILLPHIDSTLRLRGIHGKITTTRL